MFLSHYFAARYFAASYFDKSLTIAQRSYLLLAARGQFYGLQIG